MAWTKAKTAIAVAAGLLVAAGTATVAVKELNSTWISDQWWENIGDLDLKTVPAALILRPTHFANERVPVGRSLVTARIITPSGRMIGKDLGFRDLISNAYDFGYSKFGMTRMLFPPDIPKGSYDYLATLSDRPAEKLQAEIRKQLGFIARTVVCETNVFLLKTVNPALLKAKAVPGSTMPRFNETQPISYFARSWENTLRTAILDQTGSTNRYDTRSISLPATRDLQAFNQILLTNVGLQLVPSREPIEMLVVEKVK